MDLNGPSAKTGLMAYTTLTSIRSITPDPTPTPRAPAVVSRHHTSAGTVVWSRDASGRLRMTYTPDATAPSTERPLTAGGSTPDGPDRS
jgi:hypothetical protein